MAGKILGYLGRAYLAYARAVDALQRDLKSRFQRELDVAGNVIMSLPLVAFVLWLLGFGG